MGSRADSEKVKTCVVIDTNEWIKLKWLGTPLGLAFLSTLKHAPSLVLAIPEALDSELDKHRYATGVSLVKRLTEISNEIATTTGDSIAAGIVRLTPEQIDVHIRERIASVSGKVIYPEMTIAETRKALARVNAELPPNSPTQQQMKDSLIWESCISLAATYRVIFVTGDKAFYDGRSIEKGIDRNLAQEAPVKEKRLQVFPMLELAMKEFAPDDSFEDDPAVTSNHKALIMDEAFKAFSLSVRAWELDSDITYRDVSPSYFKTDLPYIFAASFYAFFYINKDQTDRPAGQAAVIGECALDTRAGNIGSVNLKSIYWDLTTPEGGVIKGDEPLDPAEE